MTDVSPPQPPRPAKKARTPRKSRPKAAPVPKVAVPSQASTAEEAVAAEVATAEVAVAPATSGPLWPSRRIHAVIARDGAALHVVEYGPADAEVTVVLAHGWTLTHGSWAATGRALTEQLTGQVADADGGLAEAGPTVRVVTYDQRAHGRSTSGLVRPFTIDQLGEDLFDVIEATAPTGPVVLGGHSMGGMTIMALAAARPELFGDRVAGVLLVGTSAGRLVPLEPPFPLRVRLRSRASLRLFGLGVRRPDLFARGRRLMPGPHTKSNIRAVKRNLFGPEADEAAVRSCAWMLHNTSVEALCAFFPALAAHDKAGRLTALASVPVHIVVGDLDKLTPMAHSRRLADELPHATLRVETACGHMVLTERPQSVIVPLRELCGAAAATSVTTAARGELT